MQDCLSHSEVNILCNYGDPYLLFITSPPHAQIQIKLCPSGQLEIRIQPTDKSYMCVCVCVKMCVCIDYIFLTCTKFCSTFKIIKITIYKCKASIKCLARDCPCSILSGEREKKAISYYSLTLSPLSHPNIHGLRM